MVAIAFECTIYDRFTALLCASAYKCLIGRVRQALHVDLRSDVSGTNVRARILQISSGG